MAKLNFVNGRTSVVLRVKILDSGSTTGAGKTGLTFGSAGLIISTIADVEAAPTAYTQAAGNIETITTLGTFAAPTSGKCRFKEVSATNHPGLYEIQIANARWAVSGAKAVIITVSGASGAAQVDAEIQLEAVPANNVELYGVAMRAPRTPGLAEVRLADAVIHGGDNAEFYLLNLAATNFAVSTGSFTTLIATNALLSFTQINDFLVTGGTIDADFIGSLSTAIRQAIADSYLARNAAGGSDGGKTVAFYQQGGLPKLVTSGDGLTFTIYGADGTTPLATGTFARLSPTVGGVEDITPGA